MPRYTKYDRKLITNVRGYCMTHKGSVYDWLLRLDLDNITEKQKQTALQLANMNSEMKQKRAIYNDELYRVCLLHPQLFQKHQQNVAQTSYYLQIGFLVLVVDCRYLHNH